PFYLALDAYFSMNAIDLLAWSVAAWIFLAILQGGSDRLWLLLGLVLGIGVENKISVLWLGGAMFAALVLTPQRALLRTRGPWIAATIAAVSFLPYALWQATHGWATLHFMWNATTEKLVETHLADFT